MKVVITGAAGFVGKALLEELTGTLAAREVCAVLRTGSSASMLRALFPTVRAMVADGPEEDLDRMLNDADVVVHLAWTSVPVTANMDMVADMAANVSGGLRLLEACGRAGIGRFIFLSSGGTVYGRGHGSPHRESAPLDPVGAYGAGKACMEHYVRLRAAHHGFQAKVLRPGNLYGSAAGNKKDQGVVEHWIESLRSGQAIEVWNGLDVVRDYVHIKDMVAVLMAAIVTDDLPDLLNVGTGRGTSLERLRDMLFAVTGRSVPLIMRGNEPPAVPWNVLDPALLERSLRGHSFAVLEEGLAREWAEAMAV